MRARPWTPSYTRPPRSARGWAASCSAAAEPRIRIRGGGFVSCGVAGAIRRRCRGGTAASDVVHARERGFAAAIPMRTRGGRSCSSSGGSAGWRVEGIAYWRLHGSPRIYASSYDNVYLRRLATKLMGAQGSGNGAMVHFRQHYVWFGGGKRSHAPVVPSRRGGEPPGSPWRGRYRRNPRRAQAARFNRGLSRFPSSAGCPSRFRRDRARGRRSG